MAGEAPGAAPARSGRPRRRAVWLGVGVTAAIAIGAVTWSLWPETDVRTVTVLGVDYTTNLDVEDHNGYPYVTVPVNTVVGSIVLEVSDADDTRTIQDFLATLDTLVPGEHVVSLGASNLHIIVDGIAEEPAESLSLTLP
ncbi:hypothetical protein [Leucobacter chromiireducens]|uniref:hypothetical protein n=1 Tax=Leucobacter chromiireducens TaxID=283877 RepID=UPI000F62D597|nr:hypothetical protein [Leucobacter chromiireducens]